MEDEYHIGIGHMCAGCEHAIIWHKGCIPIDQQLREWRQLESSQIVQPDEVSTNLNEKEKIVDRV